MAEDPIRCPVERCGKICATNYEFSAHFSLVHESPEVNNTEICLIDGCAFEYTSTSEYVAHRDAVHRNRSRVRETEDFFASEDDHAVHAEDTPQAVNTPQAENTPQAPVQTPQSSTQSRVKCGFRDCFESFASAKGLNLHIDTFHPDEYRPFPCQVEDCSRTYNANKALREHMREVHPGVEFPKFTACQWGSCDYTFSTYVDYMDHWKRVHDTRDGVEANNTTPSQPRSSSRPTARLSNVKPTRIPCTDSECSEVFDSLAEMRYHLDTRHNNSGKQLHCNDCKLGWTDPRQLASHRLAVHRVYRCTSLLCKAVEFTTKEELEDHKTEKHEKTYAKKATTSSAKPNTSEEPSPAVSSLQQNGNPSKSKGRQLIWSSDLEDPAEGDDDEGNESSGPSVENADDSDFEQSGEDWDDGTWEKAYVCPGKGCRFDHSTAQGIEKHWMTRHQSQPFPGARFAGDSSPMTAPSIREQGSMDHGDRHSPDSPTFVFKPLYDRQYSMVESKSMSERRPVKKQRAARARGSGAQAQRPMGARSFAKLALFHQDEDSPDLRPLPRPLPTGNSRWSDDEEDGVMDQGFESDSSVESNSPAPPQRLRAAAAMAGDDGYRNPDDSDSDMSDGISSFDPNETLAITSAQQNNATPAVQPAAQPAAVFHRGHVTSGLDLDSLVSFPPAPGTLDPSAVVPKVELTRNHPPPLKHVPMNFSVDPNTPHISFLMRRAKQMAADEAEEKFPGRTLARTQKKIRRRLEPYQNKPKRKYVWKTEFKNKAKVYEGNGHSGRAKDRAKALEKAVFTQAEADAAVKKFAELEEKSKLNGNGKHARADSESE